MDSLSPMNWAVLGGDDQLLELVAWLAQQSSTDRLVLCCCAGNYEHAVRALVPGIGCDASWESLLSDASLDAILVARSNFPSRHDALAQLAQSFPLLIMFPADESIFACQLDMIRREHRTLLMPYAPAVLHPAVERLRHLVQLAELSPIGVTEQLVVERTADERSAEHVLELFAMDALLLQGLAGNIHQLGALGGTRERPDYSRLSVHLRLDAERVARWSIHPGTNPPGGQISVIGTTGLARLELSGPPVAWNLNINGQRQDLSEWSPQRAMFAHFRRCLAGEMPVAEWVAVYRALEAAEAIESSCRRGRTVEFSGQTVTQQDTFKSIMAAGGCFLLMATMALVLLMVLVDALQLPLRDWWLWRQWPLLLVIPLAVFLLLQLLQLVFYSPSGGTPGERTHGDEERQRRDEDE